MKYKIIRDTQEKVGYWNFNRSEACAGVEDRHLKTGDYCLEGLEERFTIERKASTGELAQNINEKRFYRELERMETLDHAFIICEFNWEDVINFPYNSGIPAHIWKKLRTSSSRLISRITYIQTHYKVKFIFAGKYGREAATALFKRMVDLYPDEIE